MFGIHGGPHGGPHTHDARRHDPDHGGPGYEHRTFARAGFGRGAGRRGGGPFGGRGPGGFGGGPGGGFGGGFGPGGPGGGFGPGGRGPHGGRRGRGPRRPRGDVRLAVLALVGEEPMHGYQILSEIAERSGGSWRPSPGSVYPTVAQLADEGLVRSEKEEGGRSVVHLTEEGRRYAEEHRAELDGVWTSVETADDLDALRTAADGLMGATGQVAEAGTPAQVAEAARLLDDTRRRLYLVLAGEETSTDTTGPTDPGPTDPVS